jgi:hypothetical protein
MVSFREEYEKLFDGVRNAYPRFCGHENGGIKDG